MGELKLALLSLLFFSLTFLLSGCGFTNQTPAASFSANPTSGDAPLPLEVLFDASGSSYSNGRITSYSWDFGDGSTGSGQTSTHTYDSTGNYQAQLAVTDDGGATNTSTRKIEVVDTGMFINNITRKINKTPISLNTSC